MSAGKKLQPDAEATAETAVAQQEALSPLLELVKARLREVWRETGVIFWVFGFPLLMAMGLGVAFKHRAPELPRIAVVTDGPSALSEALLQSPDLLVEQRSLAVAERDLARAKIDLIVRFDRDAAGGVVDGVTEPQFQLDRMQERSRVAELVARNVLEVAAGRRDVLEIEVASSRAIGTRYIDFLIPGLIGLNLMGGSMWGVGYNLVVARKRRLLRRYAVTPMNRWHFLASYFVSRSLFLVLELGLLLVFARLVFASTLQGSLFDFALVGVLGAAAFAAVSLLIGARVETTEVATGWMNFVQLPMWVLSGIFFSYERFPEWLHLPIQLLPLTALVDGLRAVFNDGSSLFELWQPIAVMFAWAAVGFVFAVRSFRWQ